MKTPIAFLGGILCGLILTVEGRNHDYKLLSFVMPCFNRATVVGDALESIYAQDIPIPFEVICTDDGSTDETYDILCLYQQNLPNLHVFKHEQNKGSAAARNTCVNHAQGDLIFSLDSDDILQRNSIAKLLIHLYKTDADMGAFGIIKNFTDRFNVVNTFSRSPLTEITLPVMLTSRIGPASSCLFTKKSYLRAGGFPLVPTMDCWGLMFGILASGGTICVLPDAWYWRRLSPDSNLKKHEAKMSSSVVKILRQFPEIFTEGTQQYLQSKQAEEQFIRDRAFHRYKLINDKALAYLFLAYRYEEKRKYKKSLLAYTKAIQFGCDHQKVKERKRSVFKKILDQDAKSQR